MVLFEVLMPCENILVLNDCCFIYTSATNTILSKHQAVLLNDHTSNICWSIFYSMRSRNLNRSDCFGRLLKYYFSEVQSA